MMYDKKMVILSGANSVKGTAGIEKNGNTVSVDLNVFNLPNLSFGEYYFGLKKGFYSFVRALGGKGRISTRFSVPELDAEGAHVVIFDEKDVPLAYGTLDKVRLWSGNMMDGLRRGGKNETNSKTSAAPIEEKENFSYSGRQKEIQSYFNEIMPAFEYADDQIAAVNYFEGTKEEEIIESRVSPSDLYRRYINRDINSTVLEKPKPNAVLEEKIINEPTRSIPKESERNSTFNTGRISLRDNEKQGSKTEKVKVMSLREIASTSETVKVPPIQTFSAERAAKARKVTATFYEQVQFYIESLFSSGEKFNILEKLIPSSRWVKVAVDDRRYYVVGLIGSPDYICYGVPGNYSSNAPKELEGYCSWTPLKETEPTGEGFWIMYQDAVTGKSL